MKTSETEAYFLFISLFVAHIAPRL